MRVGMSPMYKFRIPSFFQIYKIPEMVFLNGTDDLSTNSIRVFTLDTGDIAAAAMVLPKKPDRNDVVVVLFFACFCVNKSEIKWILEK